MTTRRVLIAVAAAVVVSAAIFLVRSYDNSIVPTRGLPPPVASTAAPIRRTATGQSTPVLVPTRGEVEGQPALNAPKPDELSTDERSPLANRLGAAGTSAGDELGIVLDVLDAYRRMMGAYPAGENNRQIVNALLGANKEKIGFLPFDHPRLNARGEITDAWSTPFFFHLNARDSIEVRSAGPDRLLFTKDDIVIATPPPRGQHTAGTAQVPPGK